MQVGRPAIALLLAWTLLVAALVVAGLYLPVWWTSASSVVPTPRVASINRGEHCRRKCVVGEEPRFCYFRFVLATKMTMGRDCHGCETNQTSCSNRKCVLGGSKRQRLVLAINGQTPGPAVHVCTGDVVIVDAVNRLPGLQTALHWVGQSQRGTPYMDGVPGVTQCPQNSHSTFRYAFRASNAGTHMYYAHSVAQHMDGLFGLLVVESPASSEAPYINLDPIIVSPFSRNPVTYAGHQDDNVTLVALLVNGVGNGRGRFRLVSDRHHHLRLVNAAPFECPLLVALDGHHLTPLERDGGRVISPAVQRIVVFPGERYDFLLTGDRPPGRYMFRVKGYDACAGLYSEEVVEYIGAPTIDDKLTNDGAKKDFLASCHDYMEPSCRPPLRAPPLDSESPRRELLHLEAEVTVRTIFQLTSTPDYHNSSEFRKDLRDAAAYYPSYLSTRTKPLLVPQVNNVTFRYPIQPLLTHGFPYDLRCLLVPQGFVECVYFAHVARGSVVELVLEDHGMGVGAHTFHLHGYSPYHVGGSPRNLKNPPRGDTILVPPRGSATVRFLADNPGFWLLESRSLRDITGPGFRMLLRVGQDYHLPPVPDNFPTCEGFEGLVFSFT